jgi:hypothetical protein
LPQEVCFVLVALCVITWRWLLQHE